MKTATTSRLSARHMLNKCMLVHLFPRYLRFLANTRYSFFLIFTESFHSLSFYFIFFKMLLFPPPFSYRTCCALFVCLSIPLKLLACLLTVLEYCLLAYSTLPSFQPSR